MPNSGKTFNVFLCGTMAKSGYGTPEGGEKHDFPAGELVAWLADFAKKNGQQEFVDYVIFDGVGSGYADTHKYPTALTEEKTYMQAYGIGTGAGSEEIADAVTTLVQGKFQASRLPTALDKNKDYALKPGEDATEIAMMQSEDAQVQQIISAWQNQEITQVNLIGWSRGGYNAIRIAHQLYKLNPKIVVNILAFDPVPGPGRRTQDACTLPPNVKHYTSIIALNEHTSGFPPVIPNTSSSNTKLQIETTPGVHSSMVGGIPKAGILPEEQRPLTDICRQFALRTLKGWGVPVADSEINQYDEGAHWKTVHQHRSKYKDLQGTTITGIRAESKPHQSEEGEVFHHRYVTYGYLAGQADWAYLDEVRGIAHNKANIMLDEAFGIVPDTCTLHRKYNDAMIAEKIDQYLENNYPLDLQLNPYHVERLTELHDYLAGRNRLAGTDSVLKEALKKVTGRTLHLIEGYIAGSLEKSQGKKGEEDDGYEVISDSLQNVLSRLDKSFLFLAAETGSTLYVSTLGMLSKSDNDSNKIFNVKNKEGQTPLMIAAEHGHLELIRVLIKLGVSVGEDNHKDHNKTALDYAAQYGQFEIAEVLLANTPEEKRESAKIHALAIAAQHNQDDFVKRWINDLNEDHLGELDSHEILTLIIWSIEQRDEKTLTLLANDSLVVERLFEDPSVQFMPNINEVIIWAVSNNNTHIINQALEHWSRLFATDSLVEHPQIDVFLLAAVNNKRADVLDAVTVAHPSLLKLPLNEKGETLEKLHFSTLQKTLKRQDSREKLMEEIRELKAGKDRSSSLKKQPSSDALVTQPTVETAKTVSQSKKAVFTGAIAAISMGYFGLLAAVAIPPVAALLPAILVTAVVSSLTLGVPIIAAVVGVVALGAFLYFQPETPPPPKIIMPSQNIVDIHPAVENGGEGYTQKPLLHRHSWSRTESGSEVVIKTGPEIANPEPSGTPPPSPKPNQRKDLFG